MNPDPVEPYEKARTELIKRSGESSHQEIRKLLIGEELGDRRPSELLRVMKRRAESHSVTDDLMLELFQQHLPTRVQSILAAISPLTLEKAAEVADRVMEVTQLRRSRNRNLPFHKRNRSKSKHTSSAGTITNLAPAAQNVTLHVNSQKTSRLKENFPMDILVGNVSTPIIGADFLYNFRLVPDIKTNSRPVTAKARRLAPDRLRIAKAEFENMITLGHMRPSKNFEALSKAQLEDNELQSFQNDEKSSLVFKRVPSPVSATELICDTSTGSPRPFVPHNFRRTIFEHFHNLAHPGVAASFQLIASRYVWPNMRKTVKDWVRIVLLVNVQSAQTHEVLSRNNKHITININGKKSCVSLDRVKPAFVFRDLPDTIPDPIISAESSHRHPVTTNMQTTKSGRRWKHSYITDASQNERRAAIAVADLALTRVHHEEACYATPLDYAILDIRLDLVLNVRKRDLSPTALHAIALETINTRFPPEEWLHIYTDGSLLDFAQGTGIGVFSHLFSFCLHAGPLTTHFDGEVEAIHIALQQLAVRLPPIERAVILSDSTSALQALSNYNENNCLRVQNCRELLGKIKGKIVFQWVPSHCGLWGNERADFLAKKGTGILQNFRRDLTLHSAKLEIKRIFRESFRLTASRIARDKPWSTLCKKSHGIPSSPRAAAVAKFRLLTGHDCLCAHLLRFNLVTSPVCVLCDTGQDMTAAHLDECSALNDLNCIVSRGLPQTEKLVKGSLRQKKFGNLWVRASDSKLESLGLMPDATKYPPSTHGFHAEIVELEIGGVAIYRPLGKFRRAKSYCHLYGAQGQRQAYFQPLATMNFVGLDLTTLDRWH
ncbi:uncharacterized protein LOC103524116 [Trichonephila clavipes]|nr:uncharacterized protein LOC103524116 [Trichonephila clavipes]